MPRAWLAERPVSELGGGTGLILGDLPVPGGEELGGVTLW